MFIPTCAARRCAFAVATASTRGRSTVRPALDKLARSMQAFARARDRGWVDLGAVEAALGLSPIGPGAVSLAAPTCARGVRPFDLVWGRPARLPPGRAN